MPQATETLAAYGLAWGLVFFVSSPMQQARQLSLVLVDGRRALHTTQRFILVLGALLTGFVAALALTPFGAWVLGDPHGTGSGLVALAQTVLLWLAPIPLLTGATYFFSGLLIRARRTDVVSYATLAGIATRIAAVFALLPLEVVRSQPIRLPLLVIYAGTLAEMGVLWRGWVRMARQQPPAEGEALSMAYVVRFFWPLALIMAVQGVSRPAINLFIAREAGGEQALAVLTLVYSLALLPYGWVNELRSLPTPFQHWKGSLRAIRRFGLGCGLFSFAVMLGMFWTPLRETILRDWIGAADALVADAKVPLQIFTFFPLTVMVRGYLHGVALLERRTQAIAVSAPARLVAILAGLVALPALGVNGAARGVGALLAGFAVEALAVAWGLYGSQMHRLWTSGEEKERRAHV
jgi:hypothetical protein